MTAAETTWERHEAGLPPRDREERDRYVEYDAAGHRVVRTIVRLTPRPLPRHLRGSRS
jgi:hypothetical protein